jgi:ribulose-phosphate 3-epimerase
MKKIIVAPSLLAAKKIVEEAKAIENIENVWLHFDVMDGKFVPNTSFSLEDLALMRKETNLFLDVHLMIENPEVHFMDYVNNGADLVTIHYEATSDLSSLIRNIKNSGVKVGVSIKPKTEVEVLFPYLKELDLVLVMSVEPGFGGQSFIPGALEKIEKLRKEIDSNQYNCLIEVDGGINNETGDLCKESGVDILVAGSYLFGKEDILKRIDDLKI